MTSLQEIAGPWDIARFDGYVPTRLGGGDRQAYVNIAPDGLSFRIECNESGNRAHIDERGTLRNDGRGGQTLIGCSAEHVARDHKFFFFFASNPKVSWAGVKQLGLSNGRTELLLERPELRRLAFLVSPQDLTGRWLLLGMTRLRPGSGPTGEGFGHPSSVTITPTSLTYSGCGGVRFTFRYTREGRMADVFEGGRAECGGEVAGATLMAVMRGNPLVERDAGGLALTTKDYTIYFRREVTTRRPDNLHSSARIPSARGAAQAKLHGARS